MFPLVRPIVIHEFYGNFLGGCGYIHREYASLYENILILCTWRNGLRSVELDYVFQRTQAVSSERGRLLDFKFRVRLQRQNTCSKLGAHASGGLTLRRYITLTLPAPKSVVGHVFDGQPRLVSVGHVMTKLQQGCLSNNSPTAEFDEQRLRCITAYSSPRKCVRSLQ